MLDLRSLSDEVVRAAAEGSREALAEVIKVMEPRIRVMAAVRLYAAPVPSDAVDDLVQEVLTVLITAFVRLEDRTFRGLKAYVSVIVRRKTAALRQGGPAGKAGASPISLDSTLTVLSQAGPLWEVLLGKDKSPSSAAAQREFVGKVMVELGKMGPEDREVIIMGFLDELPPLEIGEQLGLTREAASMRLLRAVNRLRKNMTGSSSAEDSDGSPHV